MTKAELGMYFLCWQDSLRERDRLASLEPSPAVEQAYVRAAADEEYDRSVYLRLRAAWREEHGMAAQSPRERKVR
jgi:hypothetical protein